MNFDLIVVGGGMAGLPLANKGAYKGLETALVEKEVLGGTCLNRGCIPTKTMLASAAVAHTVRRADEHGIRTGPLRVDLGAVVDRKDRIVESIRDGAYRRVEENEHLTLIEGEASLEAGGGVRVGDRLLEAPIIVLNVGARPVIPPMEGVADVPFLTSRSALDLRELPERLLVVGGGYVGVELAQMFARFGSAVTLVQRAERLLPGEEPEIGQGLAEALVEEGLDVRTSTEAVGVERTESGVHVRLRADAGESELAASHLLLAAGRAPNTEGLGLDEVGIETDSRGFVPVDARFRTVSDGIYAIGDVTGEPMFTHSARDDADLLYRILVKDDPEATWEGRVVPHAVFTDPEVASVGLTEEEARRKGHQVSVGVQEFQGVARARAIGRTRGLIKIVADEPTGRLLGGHILGPSAGELIHELALALTLGARAHDLARAIQLHPTLSEGINAAASGAHQRQGEAGHDPLTLEWPRGFTLGLGHLPSRSRCG